MMRTILEKMIPEKINHWSEIPEVKESWIIPTDIIYEAKNGRNYGTPKGFDLDPWILKSMNYVGNLIKKDVGFLGPVWTDKRGEIYVATSPNILVSRYLSRLIIRGELNSKKPQSILSLTPPKLDKPFCGIPHTFPEFRRKNVEAVIQSLFYDMKE